MARGESREERIPLAIELGLNVIEVVRDIYGVSGEVHHDEYNVLCPVHQESDPSCDVNLVTGDWNCFSCKAKGDLATFGRHVLGKTRAEVLEVLNPTSPEGRLTAVQSKLAHLRAPKAAERKTGPDADNMHPISEYDPGPLTYLKNRGFKLSTCRRYKVRYVRETTLFRWEGEKRKRFTITHSIAIPVLDREQTLLGWCYRKTERSADWQPRYLYTPELQLADQWFGLNVAGLSDFVVVAEGALDAMWIRQGGFTSAAMLGSQVSERKADALQAFRHVVIFPDYDHAGYESVETVGSLLRGLVPCSVVRYPRFLIERMLTDEKDKLDPQDVRNVKLLRRMVDRAIPYQLWQQRERRKFASGKGSNEL